MPFWSRRRRQPESEAELPAHPDAERPAHGSAPAAGAEELELALDTLAGLLRAYGSGAFDLEGVEAEGIREASERWAQHLLVGTDEPGKTRIETADEERGEDSGARARRRTNWNGIRHFFTGHREKEGRYVRESLTDLRDAIWAFIQALSRTAMAERGEEGRVMRQMHRLRVAVERDSSRELKQQALAAVQLLQEISDQRRERHQLEMAALGKRVEAMRDQLEDVQQQASLDALTGLANRAQFDSQIQRIVDLGVLFGRPASLLMVDLDHFKWVNDNHGHLAGDAVLRAVADQLRRVFLRKDDFVARFGGEEFAVLIRDDGSEVVELAAERILQAIRDLTVPHGRTTLRVTASVGAAPLVPGESSNDWIERAARALYAAKQGGRDRHVVADRATRAS